MKIAKEGYPYILVPAIAALAAFAFQFLWTGAILAGLALFVAFFFRDPDRVFQGDERQILSPADGKVVSIRKEDGADVISIFLSVFNVHINRAPLAGRVTKVEYIPGKFLIAMDERASSENERNSITIDHGGRSIRFVQIAGLIARRIVCWKREGDVLSAGDRIGLIKFGSRVDVHFPSGSRVNVKMGQKVKAGETAIGEIT